MCKGRLENQTGSVGVTLLCDTPPPTRPRRFGRPVVEIPPAGGFIGHRGHRGQTNVRITCARIPCENPPYSAQV